MTRIIAGIPIRIAQPVKVEANGITYELTDVADPELKALRLKFGDMLVATAEQLRKRDSLDFIEARHLREAWQILCNKPLRKWWQFWK